MSSTTKRNEVVLGGSRKASPIDDEHCYLLSADEFFIIDDVAKPDKMTNAQAMMLSIGISFLVTGVIDLITGKYTVTQDEKTEILMIKVIITALYWAVSIGCLLGYWLNRKKSNLSISHYARLSVKIRNVLNITHG